MAHCLGRRPTEHLLGGVIPAAHPALATHGQDRQGGRIDQGLQLGWCAATHPRTGGGEPHPGPMLPPPHAAPRCARPPSSVWSKTITEQRVAEEALERQEAERREAAEKLQRTTQTLQTLIDASPLAIMTLDSAGRVRSWNAAAQGMFGWTAAEAVGKVVPFVPPENLDRVPGIGAAGYSRARQSPVFRWNAVAGMARESRCGSARPPLATRTAPSTA